MDAPDKRFEHINILIHGPYVNINTNCELECTVCKHKWNGRIGNRTTTFNQTGRNGCPNCAKVKQSKSKTVTDYLDQLPKIGITALESYKGSKVKHKLKCNNCDHVWEATPISCIQTNKKHGTNGCPNCNNIRRSELHQSTRERVLRQMEVMGVVSIDPNYDSRSTTTERFRFKNVNCGHEFESAPGNILYNNVRCPVCGIEERAAINRERNLRRSEEWRETASDRERYRSDVEKVTRATIAANLTVLNPLGLPIGVAGAEGSYQYDHIYACRLGYDNGVPPELMGSLDNLQLIPWEVNSFLSNKPRPYIPRIIAEHLNIRVYVQELMDVLGSCELIRDQKVLTAFSYHGVGVIFCNHDTHSITANQLDPRDKYRVRDECNALRSTGLYDHVVGVFEDEWVMNPNLVIKKIQHIAGVSTVQRKVHARKCEIKEVAFEAKRVFLDRNHLQGNDNSVVALGAYYGEELVAVMTFCKPRVLMNKRVDKIPEGTWELSRFAVDVVIRVPGIAGKLLKHFKVNYEWVSVYSYADARWSTGNVYERLGFVREHHNQPGYWYVDGKGSRMHRWRFRKDQLKRMVGYDATLTEYENVTALLNYNRIYDCGTIKYTIKNGE